MKNPGIFEDRHKLKSNLVIRVIIPFWFFAVTAIANSATQISPTYPTPVVSSQIDQEMIDNAERWGLSVSDYIRYSDIIKGPLGHWNPAIDPVLALGIYAETDSERQRYAELYAQQEYQLTQRTQAFGQAYHKAFSRLYPDAKIINSQLLQPYYQHQKQRQKSTLLFPPSRFQDNDRLLYFPAISCQDCGRNVQKWRSLLTQLADTGIDIYVAAENAEQVRQWAKANGIRPEWIKNGSVTLNIDGGLSAKLSEQVNGLDSLLYLSRGKTVFALNPEQLKQ